MNEKWGVYEDLNGDVDLYSTQEEALTAANGILDTECEDEIPPGYLSGLSVVGKIYLSEFS